MYCTYSHLSSFWLFVADKHSLFLCLTATAGGGGKNPMSLAGSISSRRLQHSQQRSSSRMFSSGPATLEEDDWQRDRTTAQCLGAELRALEEQIRACIQAIPESAVHFGASLPTLNESPSPEEQAACDRVNALREEEEQSRCCTFHFVSAEYILRQTTSLLPFQELWRVEGAVVDKTLSEVDAYHSMYATGELLAVSHRWEHPEAPDTQGVQLNAIQAHLTAHPHVRYVWYDHWCMPQGQRTASENLHFGWMLQNVNFLYLGCAVLILLDISYLSRFWTQVRAPSTLGAHVRVKRAFSADVTAFFLPCPVQMEAWLSMQLGGSTGLEPAPEGARRCVIEFLHTATSTTRDDLINMWSQKTPEDAYALLSKPDVHVTNQRDKVTQLDKVKKLAPRVTATYSAVAAEARHAQGASWMGLVQEGYSLDMLKETAVPVDDDVSNSLLGLTEKVGGVTLRGFCNLQTLNLRDKRITTGEAVALAQSLHVNASLTKIK